MAGVTQEERTQAVVASVKKVASLIDGRVILIGHSAGGMTISAVAEQAPNLLLAVIYLAGLTLPNAMPLLVMLLHETLSGTVRRYYPHHTGWRDSVDGQVHMIATVDGASGGKTTTHTLDSNHLPFPSQPAVLSKILIEFVSNLWWYRARKRRRSR